VKDYVPPEDWAGPAAQRPGLLLRKWQLEELHQATAGPAAPVYPDRVLAHRIIREPAELIALCSPAKLALGVTKKDPGGQLGEGWSWRAYRGFGIRGADGRISESVLLHLWRGRRRALFSWDRQVPDPRLMLAALVPPTPLGRTGPRHADYMAPLWWPSLAAVLALLPDPSWSTWLSTTWTIGPDGRPDDIPRARPSADIRKEIRT
jgi:hypothetical protein